MMVDEIGRIMKLKEILRKSFIHKIESLKIKFI